MSEPTVFTIDTFWSLIDQAKEHMDQGPRGSSQWLKQQLMELGTAQAAIFDDIAGSYMYMAQQYGLWIAAIVIDERCATQDGFKDFRWWLVSQGREVYMAALRDPDSLASAPDYQNQQVNLLAKMGAAAHKELTDKYVEGRYGDYEYQELEEEVRRSIVYGDGIGYPYEWSDIPDYLPHLREKYLTGAQQGRYSCDALRVNTWNLDNENIKAARRVVQKNKKVKNRESR